MQAEGDLPKLTPEEALELTQKGGTILCLDVPEKTEFGIDLRTYAVGPLFKGIKMIPSRGLHLVTCGGELERTGLFVMFRPAGVCVMEWDPSTEMLRLMQDGEQRERHEAAARRLEHDRSLGPYPLATERQWRSLSAYINEGVLQRANIPVGTFIVPGGIDDDEASADDAQMQPFFAGLARVPTFVPVDPRRPQRGKGPMLSGAALTQYHMDRSEFVLGLLLREYGQGEGSGEDAEAALLGELQLAFLIFLQLSSLRSLEQWKVLVHTLCSCEQLLLSRPGLYVKLFPVLRAQLLLAPRDFFEDELSADNFLRASLSSLASLADGHQLHAGLEAELERLWKFVLSRFGLGRSQLLAEQLGEDEDPVVVAVTEDGEQYP